MSAPSFSLSLKKPKKSKKRKGCAFEQGDEPGNSENAISLADVFTKKPKKSASNVILISEIDASKDYLQENKEASDDKPKLTIVPSETVVNNEQDETTLEEYKQIPVGQFGLAFLRGMGYSDQEEETNTEPKGRNHSKNAGMDKLGKVSSNSALSTSQLFIPLIKKPKE